jgi:hypothetical protein
MPFYLETSSSGSMKSESLDDELFFTCPHAHPWREQSLMVVLLIHLAAEEVLVASTVKVRLVLEALVDIPFPCSADSRMEVVLLILVGRGYGCKELDTYPSQSNLCMGADSVASMVVAEKVPAAAVEVSSSSLLGHRPMLQETLPAQVQCCAPMVSREQAQHH